MYNYIIALDMYNYIGSGICKYVRTYWDCMVGIRYTILYNNNGDNKFNNMNQNYRTLNRDIGLIQRSNNGWDLWFDNGDTV